MKRAYVWGALLAATATFGALGACGGDDSNGGSPDASSGGDGAGSDGTTSFDAAGTDGNVTGDDASAGDGGKDAAGDGAGDSGCTASPCIVQIAAGADQTCALVNDGTVRCWGQNKFGQLGTGALVDGGFDGTPRGTPAPVPGITGVSQVATADWGTYKSSGGVGFAGFSCVRLGNSMVSCWGNNQSGQLGRGADAATSALNLDASAVVNITSPADISLDARNGCALSTTGVISCWGYDIYGELGPVSGVGQSIVPTPSPFLIDGGVPTHVAVGRYHACALLASGEVMCWGRGRYDENGQADGGVSNPHPDPMLVGGVTGAVELVAGGFQTCARTGAGHVLCWGRNNTGQLGRDAGPIDVAGEVALPAGRTATTIGMGTNHACAALDDGSVWCWGRNFASGSTAAGKSANASGPPGGQIGASPDGGFSSTPMALPSLGGKVVQIVGGYAHTCALLQDGRVMCWGANNAGQLGRGAPDALPHPTPALVQF